MKKLSTVALALLAALMVLGFVGCKQEPDTPAGPAIVTTWENAKDEYTLSVYDDNTWKLEVKNVGSMKGTYTGDSTKDGELTCKIEEIDSTLEQGMGGAFKKDDSLTATIKGTTMIVAVRKAGQSDMMGFELTKKD